MKSTHLLNIYFQRKRKSRPGFSMRSFAKILKVSPSFVSGILSGKKFIPASRIKELSDTLDLDETATSQLAKALFSDKLKTHDLDGQENQERPSEGYDLIAKSQFSLLDPWYKIPLMDLTTCANFKNNPQWIAEKLGLSSYQVTEALRQLVAQGFLSKTENGYEKSANKIRLALNSPHEGIRKFHSSMIEKAQTLLKTEDGWQNREFTGLTVAGNPENLERARLKLIEAVHEAANLLSEGTCTDLYQINLQLFSLLKKTETS